jgi:hypothetical protein
MTITSTSTAKSFGASAVGRWVRAFVSRFRRPAELNRMSGGEFAEREDVPAETQVLLPIGPSCC